MSESPDLFVTRRDLLVLVVVSAIGGVAIAAWVMPLEASPEFAVAILSGATMLAFFLFVPVIAVRHFLEDRSVEAN